MVKMLDETQEKGTSAEVIQEKPHVRNNVEVTQKSGKISVIDGIGIDVTLPIIVLNSETHPLPLRRRYITHFLYTNGEKQVLARNEGIACFLVNLYKHQLLNISVSCFDKQYVAPGKAEEDLDFHHILNQSKESIDAWVETHDQLVFCEATAPLPYECAKDVVLLSYAGLILDQLADGAHKEEKLMVFKQAIEFAIQASSRRYSLLTLEGWRRTIHKVPQLAYLGILEEDRKQLKQLEEIRVYFHRPRAQGIVTSIK